MNTIVRNFEAVVIAALAVTFVTAFANTAIAATAVPPVKRQAVVETVPIVTIVMVGKRLSPAQKAALPN